MSPIEEQLEAAAAHMRGRTTTTWRGLQHRLAKTLARRLGRPVRIPTRTFWGQPITVASPEAQGMWLIRWGLYDEALTRLLMQRLRSGMTFLDVGANLGYISLLASRLVGEPGVVHSLDPGRSIWPLLERNVGRRPNITLSHVAAWSAETRMTFHDCGLAFSGVSGFFAPRGGAAEMKQTAYEVEATTLDAYVERHRLRPDLIKIDVESAELEVLRGARRLLARDRPGVVLEVGDCGVAGAASSRALVDEMAALGYAAYEFPDGRPVPHAPRQTYQATNLLFLARQPMDEVGPPGI